MNESTKKINEMIKSFNETFNISVNIKDEDGEQIVDGLKIDDIKNDGSQFVNQLFDIFGTIVSASDTEYELIYNEQKGLAIAKKVVKVDYIIED